MNVLRVFANPALADQSEDLSQGVVEAMAGLRVDVCLAAMFTVFISLCRENKIDPGAMFEMLLATFEQRAVSTHRGTLALH